MCYCRKCQWIIVTISTPIFYVSRLGTISRTDAEELHRLRALYEGEVNVTNKIMAFRIVPR